MKRTRVEVDAIKRAMIQFDPITNFSPARHEERKRAEGITLQTLCPRARWHSEIFQAAGRARICSLEILQLRRRPSLYLRCLPNGRQCAFKFALCSSYDGAPNIALHFSRYLTYVRNTFAATIHDIRSYLRWHTLHLDAILHTYRFFHVSHGRAICASCITCIQNPDALRSILFSRGTVLQIFAKYSAHSSVPLASVGACTRIRATVPNVHTHTSCNAI